MRYFAKVSNKRMHTHPAFWKQVIKKCAGVGVGRAEPCQAWAGPSRSAMPELRPGPGPTTSGPHSYAPCLGQSTACTDPGEGGEKFDSS